MSPMSSWGDILTEQLGGDISIDQQHQRAAGCRCSVKMSSPRGYQSRRARERTGPRAEGVPSGADVDVECFYDPGSRDRLPAQHFVPVFALRHTAGGDTFTEQLEG